MICHHDDCRTDTGRPKIWHWLCEECAEECQHHHRQLTGHPTELLVTAPTIADIKASCQAAAMMRHRRRFW